MSRLEDLPDEILIKVLCGVDHSDLKQLFQVSKLIRETTLIAKKQYFEYNTPKKIPARNSIVLNDSGEIENGEILNAPRKMRNHRRRRMSEKDMREISVALFSSSVEYLDK
ncbi:F-box protein SKIP27-like isoform X2 [Impatiens glandulifera]|nr:F-box protein SKIP27-like isoform X2 [Impatiens glandulifera]